MKITRCPVLILTYAGVSLLLVLGTVFGGKLQSHMPTVLVGLWMSLGVSCWMLFPPWIPEPPLWLAVIITLLWSALLCWPILLAAIKPKVFRRPWILGVLVIHIGLLAFLMVQGYEFYKAAIHPGGV